MLPTKFCVNLSFHLGVEVPNTFPKWRRWRPCWISDGHNFSYFWSTSHTDSSYQVSSNWLFGSGEEIPNRFSNGGHGGHLGFQIGMTLVIFFLQLSLIVSAKCLVNWSFVLREYVLNTFSKWRLWQPSLGFYRNNYGYFDQQVKSHDNSYQVSTQLAFWFRRIYWK